jgi:predicted metalloprotease
MLVNARRVWIVTAVLVLVVGAGCTVGTDPTVSGRGAAIGVGESLSPDQANTVVRDAITDVERYWSAAYPTLSGGKPFKPVSGGYHPYTEQDPPPQCGPQRWQYQPNAFYCSAGDFIAWDAQTLIPQLAADYGSLLVAVVVAHEYGHAVQLRLGLAEQATIVLEQQADCFAGGWIADVTAGHSKTFTSARAEQLDSTLAGLLSLRDQPGVGGAGPPAPRQPQ